MPEKLCSRSCSHVDEVKPEINAVKCDKDARWRGEGGACPYKMEDAVNHPSHYTQGGIECIDAIEAAVTGLSGMEALLVGQIIKYVWRYKDKNGLEDIEKAAFYLNRLKVLLKSKTS